VPSADLTYKPSALIKEQKYKALESVDSLAHMNAWWTLPSQELSSTLALRGLTSINMQQGPCTLDTRQRSRCPEPAPPPGPMNGFQGLFQWHLPPTNITTISVRKPVTETRTLWAPRCPPGGQCPTRARRGSPTSRTPCEHLPLLGTELDGGKGCKTAGALRRASPPGRS
jgi:hypothetical protein